MYSSFFITGIIISDMRQILELAKVKLLVIQTKLYTGLYGLDKQAKENTDPVVNSLSNINVIFSLPGKAILLWLGKTPTL